LAERLSKEIEGDVLFDAFSRGRYSTDASHYQIEPIGAVVPKTAGDITKIIEIAAEAGAPVLPRGAGTSQCGQTVGEAIVVDVSKHLNRIDDFDADGRTAWVEPGLVLDQLNAFLKPHGLWFPVDVSTSSRATIGGMTGNNSCGARSIRYGTMRDNVLAIEAVLMDGQTMQFGELSDNQAGAALTESQQTLVSRLLDLGHREANEIEERFPDLMRRVGGYNLDALMAGGAPQGPWAEATTTAKSLHPNLAHLLVGSEGTLAFSTRIKIALQPVPPHKVLGVCHFPTFHDAMDSTRHIVELDPSAVELVDRTMIELSRDIPMYRGTVDKFVKGTPEALLLVEFAGEDKDEQLRGLKRLGELMGELGFPGAVVDAIDPTYQKAIWEVRKSGLNIMMSMKGDGKPISFIEDCAVRLEDLAEYTARLTEVFRKHGTTGTWYAHASVGCLHVRPVLNLKTDIDAKKMRDIAEEAFAMVRQYKGSHSGEHGDGLVRSEFHEPMFGKQITKAFEDVKDAFDPAGLFNPGKIVRPSKMDDRTLFRYKPGYSVPEIETAFDWSDWGGLGGAVEMCNNNGACRKFDSGVMCPSFRVTADEKHLTRGRANTLRLALSGQLGADAFTSDALRDTMKLCVGCKGCKRECPTSVDMAKMKVEFLHHYTKRHGLKAFDRLVAYLPRYAPWASRAAPVLNFLNRLPGSGILRKLLFGFAAKRSMPTWHRNPFNAGEADSGQHEGRDVVLWADTFSTYFEPENTRAALSVLKAAGYRVHLAKPLDGTRPLCCGRTFLASGLVDEAKVEARRMLDALKPFVEKGVPVIGLEPSCSLTLRDEFKAMFPGRETDALSQLAMTFEEFLAKEQTEGRLKLDLKPANKVRALVHGHCHQKAFDVFGAVEETLRLVPGLSVETIQSGCCGMAGAFGFEDGNYDVSMKMGELDLLPAVRTATDDTLIVAGGTSCRHQILDGANRGALHPARVLKNALVEPK